MPFGRGFNSGPFSSPYGSSSGTPRYIRDASLASLDPYSEVIGGIANQGCVALGVPESICRLGEAAVNQWLGGGASGGSSAAAPLVPDCPEGFRIDPDTGRCVEVGFRGGIERILPGGQTGTLADVSGEAVVGAFGQPGILPMQRGTIQRSDGTVGPILKCPRGMVLAKDDVCYVKSAIPRRFRKWAPDPRPPVSAQDAKAIRQADRAKTRVKKLASKSGFTCKKR